MRPLQPEGDALRRVAHQQQGHRLQQVGGGCVAGFAGGLLFASRFSATQLYAHGASSSRRWSCFQYSAAFLPESRHLLPSWRAVGSTHDLIVAETGTNGIWDSIPPFSSITQTKSVVPDIFSTPMVAYRVTIAPMPRAAWLTHIPAHPGANTCARARRGRFWRATS